MKLATWVRGGTTAFGIVADDGSLFDVGRRSNGSYADLQAVVRADAAQTVNRILSFYPPHQHEQVRVMLAGTLQAAIAQRLVRRADGKGRVPAVEIMVSTGTIREALMDPRKTGQIPQAIAEGVAQYGMQTFDQSLMKLYREDLITLDEALRHASNPHEFQLHVSGVAGASETTWKTVQTGTGPEATPSAARPVRTLRREPPSG